LGDGARILIILIPHSERKGVKAESALVRQSSPPKNILFSKEKLKQINEGKALVSNEFLVMQDDLEPGYIRYQGVLYKNLAFKELMKENKLLWLPKIYVVNPYNGLAPLEEVIPCYKIKFSDKLNGKSLKIFWREILDEVVVEEEIYSLLPQEHSDVLRSWKIKQIIFPEHPSRNNHGNKAVKGKFLAKVIADNSLEEALKEFNAQVS